MCYSIRKINKIKYHSSLSPDFSFLFRLSLSLSLLDLDCYSLNSTSISTVKEIFTKQKRFLEKNTILIFSFSFVQSIICFLFLFFLLICVRACFTRVREDKYTNIHIQNYSMIYLLFLISYFFSFCIQSHLFVFSLQKKRK